ncbi:MAG: hypothetical protein JWN52_1238 [Actinomycetia bacterium]|nr:hypothetical protein [Actinomycetes bacterium]
MVAADLPGAVVLADDFGDGLDAGAAEYLAALLRRKSGQAWLGTRRPEVVRAFEATEGCGRGVMGAEGVLASR